MRSLVGIVLLVSAAGLLAAGLGTAVTYQGKLQEGGQLANGVYELRFVLFDAAAAGSPTAGPITNLNVQVSQGVFTTALDFGAGGFGDSNRWLEIAVRTNGASFFATLNPRQAVLPTPSALYAVNAGSAVTASTAVNASALAGQLAGAFALTLHSTRARTSPRGP